MMGCFKRYIFVALFLFFIQGVYAITISAPYLGCPIDYELDNIHKFQTGQLSFAGDYSSADVLVSADKVYSDSSSSNIQFEGSVYLRKEGVEVFSDRMSYYRHLGTAKIETSYLTYKGFRFWSESSSLQDNQDIININTIFSRCEGEYINLAWQVNSDKVVYHNEENTLSLYDSSLEFYGVPIFYVPWLNIPLSRRSGLLAPKIGQQTLSAYNLSSYFYSQPIFFDLGSNMDITTTFSWLEGRSSLFSNQFRYLSSLLDLEVNYDWMNKDEVLQQVDEDSQDYRRLIINAKSKLSSNWRVESKWLDLSVRSFHELFPSLILENVHQGNFTRQIVLQGDYQRHKYQAYVSQNMSLQSREQDGYLELPNLSYRYKNKFSPYQTFSFGLVGTRLITPSDRNLRNYQYIQANSVWKWNQYNGWYQNYAELGVYQGNYHMDAFTDDAGNSENSQETVYSSGYMKIGGELYLNNTQSWYPASLYSRLSPLMYYLYSPFRRPGSIPFAYYSAKQTDSFRSLLDVYRYNRDDFIGESNRIVSGLSQMLFSSQWSLRATLGKNSNITEPTSDTQLPDFDPAFSYWFGELAYNYGLLQANVNTQWKSFTDKGPERIFSQIYYEDDQKNVARINYNLHADENNVKTMANEIREYVEAGLSHQWGAWRLGYQLGYRLSDEQINSYLVGVVYDSCCWQASASIDGNVPSTDISKMDYTINIGLTFKGLAALGSGVSIEKEIYRVVTANPN